MHPVLHAQAARHCQCVQACCGTASMRPEATRGLKLIHSLKLLCCTACKGSTADTASKALRVFQRFDKWCVNTASCEQLVPQHSCPFCLRAGTISAMKPGARTDSTDSTDRRCVLSAISRESRPRRLTAARSPFLTNDDSLCLELSSRSQQQHASTTA